MRYTVQYDLVMARRPTTPRLSAADRRQRLDHAAEDLFARDGFLATSVEDIAHAAGVTKPAFYRHYESKHELVAGLLARHRDGLAMAPLTALTETAGLPVEQRLRAMLDAWFDHLDAHPIALQILHSRSGDPEIDAVLDALHDHQRAADANLLAEFAISPIPDADLIARGEIVRATLSSLALRVADGDLERTTAINAIIHTVLGLLAPRVVSLK